MMLSVSTIKATMRLVQGSFAYALNIASIPIFSVMTISTLQRQLE